MKFIDRLAHPAKSLQDYLVVILGSAVGRGAALLNSVLIARILGPEQFGKFAFFFAVMMLTWIVLGAFDTAYIRHARQAGCNRQRRELLGANLIIKTGLGLLLLGGAAAAGQSAVAGLFGKDYAGPLMTAGIGAGLFLNWLMTQATVYREKEKFYHFTLISNINSFVVLLALVGLKVAQRQFSVNAVVTIYMLSAAIAGIWSLTLLLKASRPVKPSLSLFKTFASWGKWMFLLSLVVAVFDRVDFFFLTRHLMLADIGLYAAGLQLVQVISLTTGAMNNVFVTKAVLALKSRIALRTYIRESIAPVSMIIGIIVLLMLAAPWMIEGLYGRRYIEAAVLVRILAIGWLGAAVYLPFSFIFYALDEPHTRFYLEMTKLIMGVVLLYFLVPRYGIRGAAVSIALTLLFNAIFSGAFLWRKLRRFELNIGQPARELYLATKEST